MPASHRRTRALVGGVVLFATFAVGLAAGLMSAGQSGTFEAPMTSGYSGASSAQLGAPSSGDASVRSSADSYGAKGAQPENLSAESKVTGADAGTAGGGQMLIQNASIDLRVNKVQAAISAIRSTVKRHDGVVSDLSVSAGIDSGGTPIDASSASIAPGPASASITVRVPASNLEALEKDVAKVGRVLSQSASSNDVTQEYVDLDARLKNLKAEESRLRSFLTKTNKVSDLLSVERELSRVRGEIEAMQAQFDYLKRQVARATLTITLSEPGPVVQPAGADWGFTDAVRRGIRGAAGLLTSLITAIIAVAPLAILIALAAVVVRAIYRRRRTTPSEGTDHTDVTPEDE